MSSLKVRHEFAVVAKGAKWLAKLTGGEEVPVVSGPCSEPPDGWLAVAGVMTWVEVVQVFIDRREATAVWEMARGQQRVGEFAAHDPDVTLAGNVIGEITKKCAKPGYATLAQKHGLGLLFVQIESPLAFGREFWDSATRALSALPVATGCDVFRALLMMSRIDDHAVLLELARRT